MKYFKLLKYEKDLNSKFYLIWATSRENLSSGIATS